MYVYQQPAGDSWCRLHALNAIIQGPVLNVDQLKSLAKRWEAMEPSPDALVFESVHSDGRSFLAFALEEYLPHIVALYVPVGGVKSLAQDDPASSILLSAVGALQFSESHVWALLPDDSGQWWSLDSLAGHAQQIPALALSPNTGYVLLIPLTKARTVLLPMLERRMQRLLLSENHSCAAAHENLETSVRAYAHVAARTGMPVPLALAMPHKCGMLNAARTMAWACINYSDTM